MRPLLLPPNVIDHFYVGGRPLAALRGVELPSTRRPEEWLAATVHRADDPDGGFQPTVRRSSVRRRRGRRPRGLDGVGGRCTGRGCR